MKMQSKGRITVQRVEISFTRREVEDALLSLARSKSWLPGVARRPEVESDFDFEDESVTLTIRIPGEFQEDREWKTGITMDATPNITWDL